MKQVLPSFVLPFLLLAALPVQAMHLNVISRHVYDLNIEYHVFHNEQGQFSEMQDLIKGLEAADLQSWVNVFNDAVEMVEPEESETGATSSISFGYRRNSQDIWPLACTNIPLKEFMTITLTDSGCLVDR